MADATCANCGTSNAAVMGRCREADCPQFYDQRRARRGWSPILILLLLAGLAMAASAAGLWVMLAKKPGTTVDIVDAIPLAPASPARSRPPEEIVGTPGPATTVALSPETAEAAPPPPGARANAFDGVALGLYQPSFECQGARAEALILVCYDPDLAVLDRDTEAQFERMLAKSANKDELKRRHDSWRQQLAALPADINVVEAHYRKLKEQLEKPLPPAPVEAVPVPAVVADSGGLARP